MFFFFWEVSESSNYKNIITDLHSEYNVLHYRSSIEVKWELFQSTAH